VRIDPDLLTDTDIGAALGAEMASARRDLPPDSVYPALVGREEAVAKWIHERLGSVFAPTPEETVGVNKGRHGIRPVAVWDLASRLTYRALTAKLEPHLPPLLRSRAQWKQFQRAPLQRGGRYIVASDIAGCYQHIDHCLLSEELLVQTGEYAVVDAVGALLQETGSRGYGLPQQSHASDVLAEAFLARLERSLVRRGLDVDRYNDDFLCSCDTWPQVVRSIEVLEEESRLIGLSINDLKTVTWGRTKYEAHLDDADELRREIAEEAKLDLTVFDSNPYGDTDDIEEPDQVDVDLLSAFRVVERWTKIAGRGNVPLRRRAEHRAVVELLPYALATLGSKPTSSPEILRHCTRMLRFERTLTPAVARYLATRQDGVLVLDAFDGLIRSTAYLNGWQTWWLQPPVARLPDFASGPGAKRRLGWARAALTSAEHTPVLRAEAARTLARHKAIDLSEMLSIYDRSSNIVRPVLVAGIALLKPTAAIRHAVTGDSQLNAWVYEWAAHQG
jgi:RNA-directed DNA polymerase